MASITCAAFVAGRSQHILLKRTRDVRTGHRRARTRTSLVAWRSSAILRSPLVYSDPHPSSRDQGSKLGFRIFGVARSSTLFSNTVKRNRQKLLAGKLCAALCRIPSVSDKSESFRHHFFRLFKEVSPDSSRFYQIRKRPPESFDRKPAIVSGRLNCSK